VNKLPPVGKHQESYGLKVKYPPDISRCAMEVWTINGWSCSQCSRKCGFGLNGVYCAYHAKIHPANAVEGIGHP
jgi:hypothetical protein